MIFHLNPKLYLADIFNSHISQLKIQLEYILSHNESWYFIKLLINPVYIIIVVIYHSAVLVYNVFIWGDMVKPLNYLVLKLREVIDFFINHSEIILLDTLNAGSQTW